MIYLPSFLCRLIAIGVLLGVHGAAAQTPARPPAQTPTPPPPLFSRVGVVHSIDAAAGVIVINDVQYRLPQTARVYAYDRNLPDHAAQRAGTQLKDVKALREGARIGYNVTGESSGQRGALTEVWLLPPGPIPALQAGEKHEERGRSESKADGQGPGTQRSTPRTQTTR